MDENTQKTRTQGGDRPPHMRHKKENTALLGVLRVTMLSVIAVIMLLGALLLVLPMFRVKTVVVEGNSRHSVEEIVAAAEIPEGCEILTLDKSAIGKKIFAACEYVNSVKMVRYFSTVKIVVTEAENVSYTGSNGLYYAFDRDFRVLSVSQNESDFEGFCKMELPAVAGVAIGEPLRFQNGELDIGYINALWTALDAKGIYESVTLIDASKKYSVAYVVGDGFRVELGKVDDMDMKLSLVDEILSRKGETNSVGAVINVSDLQKPTYRVIGDSEVLSA